MKIAVAFFGIPRNSDICFPSIRKNILDRFPKDAHVSCYYHLYSPQIIHNVRSGESGVLSEANYLDFQGMVGQIEKPDECLQQWNYSLLKSFGDTWKDDFASIRNLIHQLNSLYKVTQLLTPSDPDFVVFVRPDMYYHDALPSYIFSQPEGRRKNVYIPNWQWFGGLNDRFAVCGRDAYQAYGCRIVEAAEYCRHSGRSLHSERLLKYALSKHAVRTCLLPTRASRVRIGGQFAEESFSSRHSMGRRENRVFHKLATLRTLIDQIGLNRLFRDSPRKSVTPSD